jgi:hypothetical protein
VSGEKTIQAEPLLEAKIVSIVSTSLLRGVEAQQRRAKSAPSGNLSMARAIWGRRVRYSLGVRIAVRGQRPMRQLVASWEYSKVTLEEGGTWLPEMVIRQARARGALMARFW